jgi:tRNA G10  N-methylase Trm11
MNRQERWLNMGYTQEQINKHLEFERYKSKQRREWNKKMNEKNKDIIAKMKEELLNKSFQTEWANVKILKISPTNDGIGAWIKYNSKHKDGSSGDFREFVEFEYYNKENLIKYL